MNSVKWTFFPKNKKISEELNEVKEVFVSTNNKISSDSFQHKSNEVLAIIRPYLIKLGYKVEHSKKKEDKIVVPVLFGENGKQELSFEVDAYNATHGIVIEVEAGRAVTNYQFLKDLFQACLMQNVDYLCIAVRKNYKGSEDYARVCKFIDTFYLSGRMSIPLKGILIIGY